MPAGIQIFDENGNEMVGPQDFLGRILGSVNTGTSNGSVTGIDGFNQGDPFYMAVPLGVARPAYIPDIVISGTTLTWTFPSEGEHPCQIFYGVM